MTISMATVIPLVSQLGTYLKMGADHYADLRAAGRDAGPEVVALYLQGAMSKWNPKIGKAELLDDATRAAAARFLAGVAINLTGA